MKSAQEQAVEYAANTESIEVTNCTPDCGAACSSTFCNRDIANAFIAGLKAAQDIEGDLKFLNEIIEELEERNTLYLKSYTMLKDWRNELEKKLEINKEQ